MGEMTTIGEILEFAIGREAEAVEFYMAMAERVTSPFVQQFFENLVSEELEHKSRLELEMMKEGLVARTVGVLPATALNGQMVDLDKVREQMDYREALQVAINKERRSFRLYAQLSGSVPETELCEILLSLAEEESRHIAALEQYYREATADQM